MTNRRHDHPAPGLTRREALKLASAGFGYLALAGLLGQTARKATAAERPNPLAPRKPHFRPRAKRIIFLFMQGAISQVDTWEYKPRLQKDDGSVYPLSVTLPGNQRRTVYVNQLPNFGNASFSTLINSDLRPRMRK